MSWDSIAQAIIGSMQLKIASEVMVAIVLGGIIGYEREVVNKPAGFRTHMLVAGAAALMVGIGDIILDAYDYQPHAQVIRADPIRIVEAIITGISFLGAGTIFRSNGKRVEGLTTAASLLFSGAVGMVVAFDQFVLAIVVTLLAVVILRGISYIEKRIKRKDAGN